MNTKHVSTECPECEIGSLTRNNYFTGKLLVERDFKDEQRYYIDKLRLHQKRLHGEGVVCGLTVQQHQNPACRSRYVCIEPGFAKDCCGNDIVVPVEECIDITCFKSWKKLQAAQNAQGAAGQASAGKPGITTSHTLQICVKYKECPTENIPVLYDDCGCDDTACAPNRILESYEFDLLVDPTIKTRRGCLPNLVAGKALNGVTVGWLAFDPNDTWLYALNTSTPATLFQMDPTGQNINAQYGLAGSGKAIAISDDGTRVYVVAYDSNTQQSTLVVLNSTGLTLVGTSAAVNDDASPASLGALPSSHVGWLQSTGAKFLVWDASAATPVQTQSIALQGTPTGLALGGDRTKAYYIDSTNKKIGAIDISGNAALPPLTLVPNPQQVLLASPSGPDVLAVIDSTNATITAIQASPATALASIILVDQPLASAADPQKKVLYVVTSGGSPASYQLQPFDLQKLVAGTPELPPDGLSTVQPARATAVATDGHTVFLIGAGGNAASVTPGYQIESPKCPDLYALEDCEDCCKADCLVLATIRGYQPGFLIEDPAAPPTDPVTDYGNQIARIDNKLGRLILPSTRRIAEVLESVVCGCACDCQPQTVVTTNPPPVIGLNPNLPKIIDIGWVHGSQISFGQFQTLVYKTPPPPLNQPTPFLTIYFNQAMTAVDRQTFRVEITYPQMVTGSTQPGPAFTGLYNTARVQLYGILVDLVPLGVNITPHTNETPKSAWAFIPYLEFWQTLTTLPMWEGALYKNPEWPALDLPCVRVTLSGDFVYAGPAYAESGILDGDNIGGQVGLNQNRGGPITGGKNPSGDMLEGGTFQSWFYLEAPPAGAAGGQKTINVNQATSAQLQTLPGVDGALARNILAERKKSPFTSVQDFQTRLSLASEATQALANVITF